MFKTMNKKGYLYVILIFIVILIALLFSNSNDFTGNKGITAKEAESICSPYATNWTENATLVEIRTSSVSNQGEADVWYLVYAVPSEIGNKTDAVEFKVFSDRNVLKIERSPLPYWGKSLEENWTLDSDKLISIATSNERMKEWLSRYHDAEIEDFGMGINLGYSRNPICVISWISWGFLDDPHSARIIIDANTGEVLDFVRANVLPRLLPQDSLSSSSLHSSYISTTIPPSSPLWLLSLVRFCGRGWKNTWVEIF